MAGDIYEPKAVRVEKRHLIVSFDPHSRRKTGDRTSLVLGPRREQKVLHNSFQVGLRSYRIPEQCMARPSETGTVSLCHGPGRRPRKRTLGGLRAGVFPEVG